MAFNHSATKQKQEENICEICGAPDAIVKNFEHPKYGIMDWLQGLICKKCLNAGKEPDYVNKILEIEFLGDYDFDILIYELMKHRMNGDPDAEEVKKLAYLSDGLDKNEDERLLFTELFLKTRIENKLDFISKYGQGVKEEKCDICGNDNAHLCVIEDYFEGKKVILDALSLWICSDCICKCDYEFYFGVALFKFLKFKGVCRKFKENTDLYMSIKGTSQLTKEEMKNLMSTIIEQFLEINLLETKYFGGTEVMKEVRLAYKGIPVKIEIMTGKVNCFDTVEGM